MKIKMSLKMPQCHLIKYKSRGYFVTSFRSPPVGNLNSVWVVGRDLPINELVDLRMSCHG